MRHKGAFSRLTVAAAVVLLTAVPSASGNDERLEESREEPPPLTNPDWEEQRRADPGAGYRFAEAGPCRGSWEDVSSAACLHADFAELTEEQATDPIETYDPEYAVEVATNNAYCQGPDPGNRLRVFYVTTQNGTHRFAQLENVLRSKAESADYWLWKSARQTGGSRHFRYVCGSAGNISVTHLDLPNTADDSWSATRAEFRRAGFNNVANRKWLLFADWKELKNNGERSETTCGRGEVRYDAGPNQNNLNNTGDMIAVVYLPPQYCQAWASTSLHEMGHLLGAVQQTAPHHDDTNVWHPRDERDVMAYGDNTFLHSDCQAGDLNRRYDCNDNDYFNTAPGAGNWLSNHWNIADSKFLVGGGT